MPDSSPVVDLDVRRAADGDPVAFERVYRRHVARVHSLARRILGSEAEAEDATQEVFLRAWRSLGSFRAGGPFEAWLLRLARNSIVNRSVARGAAKRPPASSAVPYPETVAAPAWRPDAGLDLEAAITALPEGARQVFVLHDVEGRSHLEIADALGFTVGTSKSQLHRARSLLRARLTRSRGGPPCPILPSKD